MGESTPTREIFLHFSVWMQVAFYIVSAVASLVFLYGFYRRIRKYRQGRRENRFDHLPARVRRALLRIMAHSTLRKRDAFAGWAHFLIFWGFTFLFIGTVIVFIEHDILRFLKVSILHGPFYLGFSAVLDAWGLLFLLGIGLMAVRRYVFKPPQLDYTRPDDHGGRVDRTGYVVDDALFLLLLFIIGVTGFLIEGLRIAQTMPDFERWSFVGWWLAGQFRNLDVPGLISLHKWTWWVHAVVVMVFIAYIPYSKIMHIFTDTANLIFTDEMAARRLPPLPEPVATDGKKPALPPMGYTTIRDFTWKELLDLDACTKCGRCHYVCPARAAGTTLSPRDLILDLRTFANDVLSTEEWLKQKFLKGSRWPLVNGKAQEQALNTDVAVQVIGQETLWSCTTCMACVEACPVGIEHLTHIVQMRRHLVDLGKMDDNLQNALMSLGDYGNSFGQSPKMRARWTKDLPFTIKDARKEPVEYLWYVGDFASYDPRLQAISRQVAQVLHHAGVDFGILYDAEKNAGNDVRRVGEEGLFEMLVEDNLAVLKKARFQKIVTTDPHTLNALRNEYPEFGAKFVVEHYSELLLRLIQERRLPISRRLDYKVTYHDPCYLARYNRIIDAPRRVMEALGLELHEMPRCRENTFCCGAGGGRIWMDTSNEKKRTSEQRIEEALSLGDIQYFVTCCPKDYTMYTDAVKASGNEGRIAVRDLIEFVAEAVELAAVAGQSAAA